VNTTIRVLVSGDFHGPWAGDAGELLVCYSPALVQGHNEVTVRDSEGMYCDGVVVAAFPPCEHRVRFKLHVDLDRSSFRRQP
jgi:hypothetical protein